MVFAVVSVGHYFEDENDPCIVVNGGNESVVVASNIENCDRAFTLYRNEICMWIDVSDVLNVFPAG